MLMGKVTQEIDLVSTQKNSGSPDTRDLKSLSIITFDTQEVCWFFLPSACILVDS